MVHHGWDRAVDDRIVVCYLMANKLAVFLELL